jgi:2-(1,2-epoxy-1,2-dihydrophenyl)acetyl-CoA isomerase
VTPDGPAGEPSLEVSRQGGVLELALARPEKRNAIDDATIEALIDEVAAANQDEAIRAILLAGRGDDFCTGFDLVTRNQPDGRRPRVGSIQRRLPAQANRLIPLLCSVAAVRGWAAGLGFHLALAADFCVAARDARFWEPFVKRGFTPDSAGTWLLPRLVGVARAKELLMLGRELSGDDAASWGLIHEAVAADQVDARASALATELAAGPTVALGLTKWLVHQGSGLDLERHLSNEAFALELSSRSDDFKAGLLAMREKRDPEFEGR